MRYVSRLLTSLSLMLPLTMMMAAIDTVSPLFWSAPMVAGAVPPVTSGSGSNCWLLAAP